MRRESVEVGDPPREREALEVRLATVERAYRSLLERIEHYERERSEIRSRLESILARIGSCSSSTP